MFEKIKALYEKRNQLAETARGLLPNINDPNVEKQFEKIHTEIEGISTEIRQCERQHQLDCQLREDEVRARELEAEGRQSMGVVAASTATSSPRTSGVLSGP